MDINGIENLDELRAKPRLIILAEKEINIGFIPSGIALEFMSMQDDLEDLQNEKSYYSFADEGLI